MFKRKISILKKTSLLAPLLLLLTTNVIFAEGTVAKSDTTWMMVSTLLVMMMVCPALPLFYGGLVRAKNVLSIFAQCVGITAVILILWALLGYSLAFTDGNAFIGGLDKAFLSGLNSLTEAATFSDGVNIPEFLFVAFQGTFAAITCCLIIGGLAERVNFYAMVLFSVFWFFLAYLPVAHMVWYAGSTSEFDGYLFGDGAMDFAGGTVVHINSGIAALVGALVIGPRSGFRKEPHTPHNLNTTLVGTGLLWIGWFGFNAGSNLESNMSVALPFINTLLAPCAAVLGWAVAEWLIQKKVSFLGLASAVVSGLVIVTPACGFISPMGAILLGLIGGFLGYFGLVMVKKFLPLDDALDVFGIHGIGGTLGAILTAVFAAQQFGGIGGEDYSILAQFKVQLISVIVTIVISGVVSFVGFTLIKKIFGLRVDQETEYNGLDIGTHGENAYHA